MSQDEVPPHLSDNNTQRVGLKKHSLVPWHSAVYVRYRCLCLCQWTGTPWTANAFVKSFVEDMFTCVEKIWRRGLFLLSLNLGQRCQRDPESFSKGDGFQSLLCCNPLSFSVDHCEDLLGMRRSLSELAEGFENGSPNIDITPGYCCDDLTSRFS